MSDRPDPDVARIPARHVLRRRVWGPIGLRQGLYTGIGLAIGLVLLFALAGPLGFSVAAGVLAVSSTLGLIWGGVEVGGIAPERYLWYLLRDRWGSPRRRIWRLDEPLQPPAHGAALAAAARAQQRMARAPEPRADRPRPRAAVGPSAAERVLASPRAMAALGAGTALAGYLFALSPLLAHLVRPGGT
jgi:hypothetical protein